MLKTKQTFAHLLRAFSVFLLCAFVAPALTSCGDDDEDEIIEEPATPDLTSIVDTWEYSYDYPDNDNNSASGMIPTESKIILIFNSDYTGSIDECDIYSDTYQSKATYKDTYQMKFNWATTSDSYGNNYLNISYISGDKNTSLFNDGSDIVLWTRQYVLTGNILNVYSSDGEYVTVFNRK